MLSVQPAFQDLAVESVFASFPEAVRSGLLDLRSLIFETAETTPGVGRIGEMLKWGQPAYLTPATKSGSTVRLGPTKHGGFAMFVHCRTTIIPEFRGLFPDDFAYEGDRAIHFAAGDRLPTEPLRLFIVMALTYRLKRRNRA